MRELPISTGAREVERQLGMPSRESASCAAITDTVASHASLMASPRSPRGRRGGQPRRVGPRTLSPRLNWKNSEHRLDERDEVAPIAATGGTQVVEILAERSGPPESRTPDPLIASFATAADAIRRSYQNPPSASKKSISFMVG